MTATVSSLEEFLAKRRADQERLTPAVDRIPLVGIVAFSDGSWRVTERVAETGVAWDTAFNALAEACEALMKLYYERRK